MYAGCIAAQRLRTRAVSPLVLVVSPQRPSRAYEVDFYFITCHVCARPRIHPITNIFGNVERVTSGEVLWAAG